MKYALALLVAFSPAICSCQGIFSPRRSIVEEAEELTREERYDEAIELYRNHISKRLTVADRPDWENPFLYLLAIGDLRLKQDNVDEAIALYEEAEKKGVAAPLVSDRYRGIAVYYESKHELEKAVEILARYRDRDPLLFDGMLDRLSKQIVAEEDLVDDK